MLMLLWHAFLSAAWQFADSPYVCGECLATITFPTSDSAMVISAVYCTCADEHCSKHSVRVATRVILYMVRTAYGLVCSVSNVTPLLWAGLVHMVFLLCTFSVRAEWHITDSTERIDHDVPEALNWRARYFGDYSDMQFFLQAESLHTRPVASDHAILGKPNECATSL